MLVDYFCRLNSAASKSDHRFSSYLDFTMTISNFINNSQSHWNFQLWYHRCFKISYYHHLVGYDLMITAYELMESHLY